MDRIKQYTSIYDIRLYDIVKVTVEKAEDYFIEAVGTIQKIDIYPPLCAILYVHMEHGAVTVTISEEEIHLVSKVK